MLADHVRFSADCTTPDGWKSLLGEPFEHWFGKRGWFPRAHQIELVKRARTGDSTLLIAPTGAGKTLAGFLPSLTTLAGVETRKPGERHRGVHTLYISPLKALAVDIQRNLMTPISEMGLYIAVETRTGDTPVHKRQRQKLSPPQIMLTTPEQVALMLVMKRNEDHRLAVVRHGLLGQALVSRTRCSPREVVLGRR